MAREIDDMIGVALDELSKRQRMRAMMPASETKLNARLNFTMTPDEALSWHAFARDQAAPGERPNLSGVVRKAMREYIAKASKKSRKNSDPPS